MGRGGAACATAGGRVRKEGRLSLMWSLIVLNSVAMLIALLFPGPSWARLSMAGAVGVATFVLMAMLA